MQYPSNSRFKSDSVAILRLATPLVGGQIAVVGMTVTDIYMAGRYSVEALAAVQLGGNIWSIITLLIIGIMIGNNPIIGNYKFFFHINYCKIRVETLLNKTSFFYSK